MSRIGVMFDRDQRPEELRDFAREVESLGADDLWVVEDLAWAGAVSSATLALTATDRLRVGIGIMPAPLRNPALLAMELATLARVFPDRLVAGIGHGVPAWMAQVGAANPARLALLEETVTAVRTLLRGRTAHVDGRAPSVSTMCAWSTLRPNPRLSSPASCAPVPWNSPAAAPTARSWPKGRARQPSVPPSPTSRRAGHPRPPPPRPTS